MAEADSPEVLTLKIASLVDVMGEVRDRIKEMGQAVSAIGIMDLQAKQNSAEIDKLRTELHRLAKQIVDAQTELEQQIRGGDNSVTAIVGAHAETQSGHNHETDRKFNIAYGVILAVSVLSGGISAFATVTIRGLTSKVEESYQYTQSLKTLRADDQLRLLMRQLPITPPPQK